MVKFVATPIWLRQYVYTVIMRQLVCMIMGHLWHGLGDGEGGLAQTQGLGIHRLKLKALLPTHVYLNGQTHKIMIPFSLFLSLKPLKWAFNEQSWRFYCFSGREK